MDPLIGQLIGSYRVTEQIGQGGMGRIYRAEQPSIGARVAIKVLAPDRARDVTEIERFFAEARVVNVIRHESIVNVLDLRVLPDGSPCIVMEHLEGAPLVQVIETRGRLPAKEVCGIALEVLDALSAAHDKGVVHRDLTPANIFVTKGGHAKILDFGIAKLMSRESGSGPTLAGQMIGTPAYVSPEQIRGASDVDGRADLYALGAVLFEALTGKPPFVATSAYDLLHAHEHVIPSAPHAIAPSVPIGVSNVVLRSLEKDPRMRFANASDMAHALKSALDTEDEPVPDTVIPDTVPADETGRAPRQAQTSPARARTASMAKASTKAERTHMVMAIAAVATVGLLLALPFAARSRMRANVVVPAKQQQQQQQQQSVLVSNDPNVLPVPNPNGFDPSAFLPRAVALAESQARDVRLVELNITPVDRGGLVDVSNQRHSANVAYSFSGTKDGAPISVFVIATMREVRVTTGPENHFPVVPIPRCTLKELVAAAAEPGDYAQITYNGLHPRETPWSVTSTTGGGNHMLADDCKR